MKNIVALAAVVAVTAILASTTSFARVDDSRGAAPSVDRIATQFRGQGAWIVVDTLGGKDAVAAAEHAGVVFMILGLGGVAILTRIRFQAEKAAQRARRRPFS